MAYFAVIDIEPNWADKVMSIGTVIADADTFKPVAAKYHILPVYCEIGGQTRLMTYHGDHGRTLKP